MPIQASSLDERRARIQKFSETSYQDQEDAARDYLIAIEGATPEEQYSLFSLVLRWHGARHKQRVQEATDRLMPHATWMKHRNRLHSVVRSWTRQAQRLNEDVERTAKQLWDQLTLQEGDERIVALELIFRHGLTPYAKLPFELMVVQPTDVYDEACDRIISQIGIIERVISESSSQLEFLEAAVRMMESMTQHEDRIAFLRYIFNQVYTALSEEIRAGLLKDIQ